MIRRVEKIDNRWLIMLYNIYDVRKLEILYYCVIHSYQVWYLKILVVKVSWTLYQLPSTLQCPGDVVDEFSIQPAESGSSMAEMKL